MEFNPLPAPGEVAKNAVAFASFDSNLRVVAGADGPRIIWFGPTGAWLFTGSEVWRNNAPTGTGPGPEPAAWNMDDDGRHTLHRRSQHTDRSFSTSIEVRPDSGGHRCRFSRSGAFSDCQPPPSDEFSVIVLKRNGQLLLLRRPHACPATELLPLEDFEAQRMRPSGQARESHV